MNDKTQIEEMEKFIIKTRNILKNILLVGSRPVKNTSKKDCYFCLMNLQELYKSNSSISDKDFLKILFESKLLEDTVVLSKEEFEEILKRNKELIEEIEESYYNELIIPEARKETAKKIINWFKENSVCIPSDEDINEFAKQFGVEIKE